MDLLPVLAPAHCLVMLDALAAPQPVQDQLLFGDAIRREQEGDRLA